MLVCGQTIELQGIQPTKSASGFYEVTADSHYDVKVEFQPGARLQKEIGYVTNGHDFHDEVIVTDGDIELTHTTVVASENRYTRRLASNPCTRFVLNLSETWETFPISSRC